MKSKALLSRVAALLGAWAPIAGAELVTTTLNLVDEPAVNELAVSLTIPQFQTGNDTTNLSGTVDATIEIDPATGVVTQLTFTGGNVTGTPITLAGDSTNLLNPGSYSFSSTPLSGTVVTPLPPGVVDNAPGQGDFDSARHDLIINGGVLSGTVDSLFVNEVVNQDFSVSPVTSAGSGIGNIAAVFRGDLSTPSNSVFDLVVFVGVASTSDVLVGSTTVTFGSSGTIKLAGQVSVPFLPLFYNFSPNPQIVTDGSTLGLDYDVDGASSLSIDQGVGGVAPPQGTRTVTPPAGTDTTYTMTATNGNGSVTRSTTVRSVAPGSATYRYVRFIPVRLKGDLPEYGPADGIQMAEFQFFGGGMERVPIAAVSPGQNSPAGEEPASLIDGNPGTKWFDFRQNATVIFDFAAPVTIDSYGFTTANDFEPRDPVAWCLEGSDDQASWLIIESITVRQDDPTQDFNHFTPVARQAATQVLPIPASPAVVPPVIAGFRASPQILANGGSSTLAWETMATTSLAIDNAVGPVAGDSGSTMVAPPADTDTTYTLTAANGAGEMVAESTNVRTVVPGTATHRYIRFTALRLAETLPGFGGANGIQLADFEFLDGATPVAPAGVTNPGGASPAGEEAVNVLDGNPATKWLDFNKGPLVFDFGAPAAVTAYRWTTGNDEPSRDPVAWLLEGSDDGNSWTLVDSAYRNRANPAEDISFYHGLPRGETIPAIPVPAASSILPVIKQFVGDAPFLVSGEPLRLTWETCGASSVSIDSGVGTVGAAGSAVENPAVGTTYTLTASTAAGSISEQFTTVIVTPSLTRICYEGFDLAGDELALLDDAVVVNDFGNIPLPGDLDRLRLTPDLDGRTGTAWFRKRVDLSQGFQTFFDLHLLGASNSGADGLSFIIQDRPEGTAATPGGLNERGLSTRAFNISFDSYFNDGEPSAGFIQVLDGTTVLATVDLTVIGGITLPGSVPNDLSSDDFTVAPYAVRIAYVPGDLDIFFEGVLVVDSLAVDLGTTEAVDGNGTAYVGFSARTGGFFESHDVTRWILTEGPPAPPLVITDFSVDLASDTAVFTFQSSEFRTYRIEHSSDGIGFTDLATGIPGAAGSSLTTTAPIGFIETPVRIFRVVDEKP